MSLINDALKRARQTQQPSPFEGRPVVPLKPVDYAARPNRVFRALVGLAILASLAFSAWFFWKWWRSGGEARQAPPTPSQTRAASIEPARPAAPSAPRKQAIQVSTNLVVRTNFPAPPPRRTEPRPTSEATPAAPSPTNAVASEPATNPPVPAPVPAPAPPPSPFADLKLQSIIFREGKPSAVINGDMVSVGDKIRGARVLAIEPQAVTVQRGGETNELRLPRL